MTEPYTELVCIVDRSGSMSDLAADTIGGFNTFVEHQRANGRANITLVLFDHEYEVPWAHIDLNDAPRLDEKTYWVRGSTALLDAVGRTINEVRGRLANRETAPEHVVVLVITDGYENSSREYSAKQTRGLVEQARADGWEFVFIGADIDAFEVAQAIAIDAAGTTNVAKSARGMREAYSKMSRAVDNLRTTGSVGDVDSPLDEDGWI